MADRRPSLSVEVTPFCNLGCRHCYNAFGHASTSSLTEDELLSILRRALSEVSFKRVSITGGEPLSHPGLLRVLKLCSDGEVPVNIITNATLATPSLASQLPPLVSTVQVTLNGHCAEVHDKAVGVTGAWQRTMNGIANLQKYPIALTGSMVLTHQTAQFAGETLALFQRIGIERVGMSRFMPAGGSARNLDLLPTRGDLLGACRQASDARFDGMTLRISGPIPPCIIDPSEFPKLSFGWCANGTSHQDFALGSDGCLRQCVSLITELGSARKDSVAELMNSSAVKVYRKRRVPRFCRGCVERPRCLGGCGASALEVFGNQYALDPLVAQHIDPRFARFLRARERAASNRRDERVAHSRTPGTA